MERLSSRGRITEHCSNLWMIYWLIKDTVTGQHLVEMLLKSELVADSVELTRSCCVLSLSHISPCVMVLLRDRLHSQRLLASPIGQKLF